LSRIPEETVRQRILVYLSVRIAASTICLATLIVIITSIGQAGSVYALAPTAAVTSVTHPSTVSLGVPFVVVVTVDYSDKFLADIGVWDPEAGIMIRSVTLISSFTGPGETNFTFQLTALRSQAKWHLIALTRVWWEDAWYQDPKGGTMPFDVSITTPNINVDLTLVSTIPTSTIGVDGISHSLGNSQPLTLELQPGMHTLQAEQLVPGEQGERFVFTGWSDGVNSNPRTLPITTNTNVVALYGKEYYLKVTSSANQPIGEGWYPEGTLATFGIAPTTYHLTRWSGFLTYDYRFSGWKGDSDSAGNTASIIMDGPKSVNAQWVQTGTQIDLLTVGALVLLAAVPLAIRVGYVYGRRKSSGGHSPVTLLKHGIKFLVVLSIIVISLMSTIPVHAQLPVQPHATVVKIGDAYWYYWNQPQSDTCILWLGGGISQETFSGYNYYWVNPFDYESFGTIHFIQDLSSYYCAMALEKGSYAAVNAAANRTIYQELFNIQSTIIADVHAWIKQQGYAHTVLMGYSVGGQAAAMELAIRDPGNWTNADSVVLITVPLENTVINHAHSIKPNLLFLYGGNLPDFVATGQRFYDNAPAEGWQGSVNYHKEFHVLSEVGHEVWTVRDTGEYITTARNTVINFIEKSKALQFAPEFGSIGEASVGNWSYNITSVRVPSRIAPGDIIPVEVDVSKKSSSLGPLTVLAYDQVSAEPLSAESFIVGSAGSATVDLVIGPHNSTTLSLRIILMQKIEGKWSLAAQPRSVKATVSDLVTLRLASKLPNLTFLIDGAQHTTDQAGHFEMESLRGTHIVLAPPVLYDGNVTRLVFTQWDDSNTSTLRQVTLENDTTLTAIYRRQYYLTVTSPYGTPLGSGWYDENSTATILVQPPIVAQESVAFSRWISDATGTQPSTSIFMNSPKTAEAEWNHLGVEPPQSNDTSVLWVIFSGMVFAVLLIVNLKRRS
jgi:hypothetical protein